MSSKYRSYVSPDFGKHKKSGSPAKSRAAAASGL